MLRIGVLASHQGTNFQAIVDACVSGTLNASVNILICNNSDAPVMQRAITASIPTRHFSSQTHPDHGELGEAICTALNSAKIDLVVLAGYMKKLHPKLLAQYRDRIINVHPSLLPKFGGPGYYGRKVHEAVLAANESETGATVHLVTENYDEGAVLAQESIPITPGETIDSLAGRVHPLEHELLLSVIERYAMH